MIICKQCGNNRYTIKGLCQLCYNKNWYIKNREKHIGKVREYQIEHKENIMKYNNEYKIIHKLERKKYQTGWYKKNKEQHIKNVAEDKELRKEKYIMQS